MKYKAFFGWAVTLLLTLFSLFPLIFVLKVSLSSTNSFLTQDFFRSSPIAFMHFKDLFTKSDFLLWIKNSFLLASSVTGLGLALSSLGGYALSRLKTPLQSQLVFMILLSQMFPATLLLLPFSVLLAYFGLLDSFVGLAIIYSTTALPFCLWQMKSFYDSLPKELEEASWIDGASPWRVFVKVILPLARPALLVTGLFSFLTAWCEYVIAAIVIQDPELLTLPLGLKSFHSSLSTQWGLFAAGSLVASIPVVVLFILFTRNLIQGLTAGGVKG
jgi:arabinogalactan oligomer/maltooligosaccharide transport system permease protein